MKEKVQYIILFLIILSSSYYSEVLFAQEKKATVKTKQIVMEISSMFVPLKYPPDTLRTAFYFDNKKIENKDTLYINFDRQEYPINIKQSLGNETWALKVGQTNESFSVNGKQVSGTKPRKTVNDANPSQSALDTIRTKGSAPPPEIGSPTDFYVPIKEGTNKFLIEGETNTTHCKQALNFTVINAYRKPTLHLVAIAIDTYENSATGSLPSLRLSIKGAKKWIEVMNKMNTNNNLYKAVKVHTKYNSEASGQNIRKLFQQIKREVKETDIVMVYFSGHGEKDYLLPYDTKLSTLDSNLDVDLDDGINIRTSKINDFLNDIKCKSLLVLDACHTNFMAESIKVPLKQKKVFSQKNDITDYLVKYKVANITIGSSYNRVQEQCADWAYSPLTQMLLNGIAPKESAIQARAADRNRDNIIDLAELITFLNKENKEVKEKCTYAPDIFIKQEKTFNFPIFAY